MKKLIEKSKSKTKKKINKKKLLAMHDPKANRMLRNVIKSHNLPIELL